jgi:hypothetical protein
MTHHSKSRSGGVARMIVALLAGLTAPVALAAASAPPPQIVTVRVDRYTFDDWTSGDIDAVATTLRATRPDSVELVACGPDAFRALLSAAARLNDLPLRLQVLSTTAPACSSVPSTAAGALSASASGAAEAAVAHYWLQVMP